MAGGRASPTATLLRNSRLFSLPPPLPRPLRALGAAAISDSNTATLPYPTHAAIRTTPSSLSRGDWGLKRSLPSRTLGRTSTPLVRIGDIDSIDHITDFESAADLTITLRKFQEFELPISKLQRRPKRASFPRGLQSAQSVFEKKNDNIQDIGGDPDATRWKFNGPWLPGETEQRFQDYIKNKISGRSIEFRDFVREQLAQKELGDSQESARDRSEDITQDPTEISDQRLDDHIRYLRQNPTDLRQMIECFLDLPRNARSSGPYSVQTVSEDEHDYDVVGPPITHPSAGLSYLRTASRIPNHPILGPQDAKPPVQGRFLKPQANSQGYKRFRAIVGIGGVVADDSKITFQRDGEPPGGASFNPDIPGGGKHWYQPERAAIDSRGRIRLHVQRTESSTLSIHHGVMDQEPDPTYEPAVRGDSRSFPTSSDSWRHTPSSNTQGYGLVGGTLPNQPSSNGRVQPLDLKRSTDPAESLAMLKVGRFRGASVQSK
jgi:hypothetical protein